MSGVRVDLRLVDRLEIKVLYKETGMVRWCMTPLSATTEEPELVLKPYLANGPLLDELGQATMRQWDGKTESAEKVVARLQGQQATAAEKTAPVGFSRWGGWKQKCIKDQATGFFRTWHDGSRWWLLDPDGHSFWSAGPCCVQPKIETTISLLRDALTWLPEKESEYSDCFITRESDVDLSLNGEGEAFDYLRANFIRAFGKKNWRNKWEELVFPLMREIGFNTVANWSDMSAASRAGMPYVIPMVPASHHSQVPRIFRDFPDVYSDGFVREAEDFARQLAATSTDPAVIGYFLMNEPQWGFTDMLLMEGILWNTPVCDSRKSFARWLEEQYGDSGQLAEAWAMHVTLEEVASGVWTHPFTPQALEDLKSFSSRLVNILYGTLSKVCRRVAPNHLNLGARFSSIPKDWVIDAMGSFDVFSINCYQPEVDPRLEGVCHRLNVPAMIGEWHYGALDAGLPAPGIGHVATQEDRGRAYRYYIETSASRPWCVGAHWFTLYDQSAIGRFDGENYNIGFIDTCHRVYEPLLNAARITHERLYAVASGEVEPFSDSPGIVERLNM
jgi:hypothetical protein